MHKRFFLQKFNIFNIAFPYIKLNCHFIDYPTFNFLIISVKRIFFNILPINLFFLITKDIDRKGSKEVNHRGLLPQVTRVTSRKELIKYNWPLCGCT